MVVLFEDEKFVQINKGSPSMFLFECSLVTFLNSFDVWCVLDWKMFNMNGMSSLFAQEGPLLEIKIGAIVVNIQFRKAQCQVIVSPFVNVIFFVLGHGTNDGGFGVFPIIELDAC